jgi:trigger factor
MENPSSQTLSKSQVTCVVNKKPGCQIEFEVTVSKELINPAKAKAIKLVGKGLSIPGFRKGKVPEAFVLQRFPKEVQEKWQEYVVHVALQECYKQTGIVPLNKDKVGFKMKSFSAEEAAFSFFFEVYPEIPHVDASTFKLQEIKRPVVDEAKVAETIRQTLFFYATWQKVENKPVQEGDFLMLDLELMETNPPSTLFKNTRFEVTDNSMAKWMKDLLIGRNVGDVVEGVSVPDESADPIEKETLKPQKVRITIKDMELPTLPEMTPELFKNLGVESGEDLQKKVELLLNKQADDHVKEQQRSQVQQFLLTQYPFDLPSTLINNEVHFRVSQLNKSEEFLQHWRSLDPEGQKKMIEVIKSQSEKAVKLFHLSNQLLREKHLSPSAYSLPKPAETQLEALINPGQMDYHEQPELRRAEAISKLILEQAEDYIIAQATGNVV